MQIVCQVCGVIEYCDFQPCEKCEFGPMLSPICQKLSQKLQDDVLAYCEICYAITNWNYRAICLELLVQDLALVLDAKRVFIDERVKKPTIRNNTATLRIRSFDRYAYDRQIDAEIKLRSAELQQQIRTDEARRSHLARQALKGNIAKTLPWLRKR